MIGDSRDMAVNFPGIQVLLAIASIAAGLSPPESLAEGALAIGHPVDVAKDGFAFGLSYNYATQADAEANALRLCRNAKATKKSRSLCTVIENYSNRCMAVAIDPADGTPGVGWGGGDNLGEAESEALFECRSTAGPDRQGACQVSVSDCDGVAK
jgi:hypothetical protein